jgi:GntR family transcriptional regulator
MYKQLSREGKMSETMLLGDRRIDRALPIPYYYQIAEILRGMIADSRIGPDTETALPSENELCGLYAVTRATVRHALDLLEREGLVYRRKGKGTFLRRRVQLDLARLCSTTKDMQARGWVPGTRLLGARLVTASAHIQRQLRIQENPPQVWEIHRLRLADGEPISLQWSYVSCQRAPGLDKHDLAGSLYDTLRAGYGIELRTAEQVIRTRMATDEEALTLSIPAGAPVFVIDRTSFDQAEKPVEHLHALWRGDRYDLQIRLSA